MPDTSNASQAEQLLQQLIDVMAMLRSERGCPWDQAQTHRSLQKYLIEETYEVIDAIDSQNKDALCEELGDLLLQIVFHARIAEEDGHFTMADVIQGIVEKLIRRHPHVFSNEKAKDEDDVRTIWEHVKAQERQENKEPSSSASLMDDILRHAPSLLYAESVGKRAADVGFDWERADQVWEKLREECNELEHALKEQSGSVQHEPSAHVVEEWGDIAFSLVNLARHLRIDPEIALRQAAGKFEKRFRAMESLAQERKSPLEALTLERMDALWNEVKQNES